MPGQITIIAPDIVACLTVAPARTFSGTGFATVQSFGNLPVALASTGLTVSNQGFS